MEAEKNRKVCVKGHAYYKSSDCPTCPFCNKENKPASGFLSQLSSPARNALLHEEIDTLDKLSAYSEKDILKLHGVGSASLPVLRAVLEQAGLSFKA
ncbi:RNA polymerase alpha subunit C-terminal domain-containing protein [Planococcus sp. ISL-109]|uniref:RNA polymerase alpha subunit C-terminal domain-containing protein n=1 Tax=Planococcus sp. ISL-109 TaxID=2819166 RepID=UPI001BECDD34|nr:RNA polymerase alpha subunit C-terminal domain-containing protein [Planococcus sp. ISL-109]MBT2582612.1 RNA polymerase alpha subunit C-terminal domain-containing protein [Planococcus sp. ISL-109]